MWALQTGRRAGIDGSRPIGPAKGFQDTAERQGYSSGRPRTATLRLPADRREPERYTHISIDAFTGRSLKAKRKLYKTIVANLEPFEIPPDHVEILLRELPKENWHPRRAGGLRR
jgi:hypothetical protein